MAKCVQSRDVTIRYSMKLFAFAAPKTTPKLVLLGYVNLLYRICMKLFVHKCLNKVNDKTKNKIK